MDRLTNPNGDGFIACNGCMKPMCTDCEEFKKQAAKMAEYENTGLTPAEVAELAQAKKDVYAIANNALYFSDSSDYEAALWGILRLLNPSLDVFSELRYIDQAEAQATLERMEGQE